MANINLINITVNKIEFINNFLEQKEFVFEPKLKKAITKIDDARYVVALKMEVKNTDEKPFPFNILCELQGVFDITNESDEKEIKDFLNKQGVQILFPYLRSLIMTITTSSFVSPLVLPIIDVTKDLVDEKEKI